ncbi:copper homeostasis periplasmic binding protein CopC [Paraburkholderia sp.]|uniref:copper homeostasis periplasmic binding protein CopC n=1 Tax=Paraburkholderia sp. TaxID=1926495 RepID=UPI0023973F3B|nr:copper homeostasis periplasmic binding protein CopC [Paraburkholderia sp.]MDE1179542.1 copper homeostasis periplasmic binding protein CopC [Paraburkholderia sp.]
MKLSDFSRPALRALAVVALAATMTTTAFAHARPVSSEPVPNTEVAAPGDVTIHFSEPLEPAFTRMSVKDASGKSVAQGAAQVDAHDAKTLHLPLQPLAAGHYAVHWTAVATDGHRTQGDFAFSVK